MRIKITADSTCDLPRELIEKYDITLMPLTVIKDGENYLDNVTITPADIFAHVASGGALCSTAAGNIGDYQQLFGKYRFATCSVQIFYSQNSSAADRFYRKPCNQCTENVA